MYEPTYEDIGIIVDFFMSWKIVDFLVNTVNRYGKLKFPGASKTVQGIMKEIVVILTRLCLLLLTSVF